jgi:hypothetical protein
LISILLPSLQRAREQAKITSCKANCKQIGTIMAMYQTEEKGFVPVMFNYYSNGLTFSNAGPTDPPSPPARTCWLSVAFSKYDKGTAKMPSWLPSPNAFWTSAQRQDYEDKVLPEFYVCPFERGKGPGEVFKQFVTIGGTTYEEWNWEGRHDLYQTWKWDGLVVRNERATNGAGVLPLYPGDPGGKVTKPIDGRPRYSALCWNQIKPQQYPQYQPYYSPSFTLQQFDVNTINKHRQWTKADAQRVKTSSLSEVTVIYCAQGNYLGRTPDRMNPESHRTSLGAGTNTVFADSHVEWVKGTQIGWP